MKKFSITVDDDLYEIIKKDSLSNKVSKAEVLRRRLVEAYYASAKQEEKVVQRFEEFEKKIIQMTDEKLERINIQGVRNLTYTLANFHLLKLIVRDTICSDMDEENRTKTLREYASYAKALALKVHPVDSLNSKESIVDNILPEHLK